MKRRLKHFEIRMKAVSTTCRLISFGMNYDKQNEDKGTLFIVVVKARNPRTETGDPTAKGKSTSTWG